MTEWLLAQSYSVVYCGLFALLLTGALGFPPEDVTLLLGGVVVHHGRGDLLYIFLICYFGTIIGDLFIYLVGRRYGAALFNKSWLRSRVPPSRLRWVRRGLDKRAFPTIFVARHLFYLRTLTFLTCGVVKMRFMRFLFADAVSALVSVPLMLAIGYQASDNYQAVLAYIGRAKILSLFLVFLAIAGIVWLIFRSRIDREESEESKKD